MATRSFVTRSTGCLFRCLPAAVLSVTAQKVPKEAAQRGVERLAPARRATPPRPPQARPFVFASTHLCFLRGACNLRSSSNSTTGKRIDFYLWKRLDKPEFEENLTLKKGGVLRHPLNCTLGYWIKPCWRSPERGSACGERSP